MQIDYVQTVLDNGLKVQVHTDRSTAMVAFNLVYNVGARDEHPDKTGFAHLFEHLMFSGSRHVKDFDTELDKVGAANNAFTNNDFTDFYITILPDALETAFRVESDRMQYLTINQKKLDVQKGVVIEEFKERCLNQPYGDSDLLIRPLCYTVHPYAWSTIGKKPEHIESVTLDDVRSFYDTYYKPDNAILTVAGPVEAETVFELAQRYFGGIPKGNRPSRNLPQEPMQTQARTQVVERKVPANVIYKAFHMGPRMSDDFYVFDLVSDILSNGDSSRFHTTLVKGKKLFNSVNAYVSGDIEPGMFLVSGFLEEGVSFEKAEAAINEEILRMAENEVGADELQKVKNKLETALMFSNMKALDKAMNLGYFELMGSASLLNEEDRKYRNVEASRIREAVERYLCPSNCSTIYYKAVK
ncbi:MAG: insulinase family protein [Bacteroides sp.]|nr:insulinase family protein [Ruminococcus flavefaciens]MCM1554091.1 insulinase family protein [Bacteroides sp.]